MSDSSDPADAGRPPLPPLPLQRRSPGVTVERAPDPLVQRDSPPEGVSLDQSPVGGGGADAASLDGAVSSRGGSAFGFTAGEKYNQVEQVQHRPLSSHSQDSGAHDANLTMKPAQPGSLCGRCAACGGPCGNGWALRNPEGTSGPGSQLGQHASVLLEDRNMLSELGDTMMGKVNHVLAFLQQTVTRERGKHASDISMMMRKVDKDLKDTFLNVRETFAGLTDQLTQLVQEVENGRKQVRSIQAKYAAAKEAAEAQAQYVVELEAVLDSQGSGLSDVLKNLSTQYSSTQQALAKLTEEGKQRVLALQKENKELKARLRRFEDEEKELMSGKEPPMLPEMAASWTRHMTPSTRAPSTGSTPRVEARRSTSSRAGHSEVVASMMAHCDARRAAPRTKLVQPQARQPLFREEPRVQSPRTPTRKKDDEAIFELRRRAEIAEERCKKQHRLMTFASGALVLLKEIFLELRRSRCLTGLDEPKVHKTSHVVEAADVIERIVQLFSGAIPQLGNLAEVIAALGQEAARPPPPRSETGGRAQEVLAQD